MSLAEANSGTTAVRDGYRFDEAALDRWMRENVDGYAGPLAIEQFKGGQSNPTFKLVTPGRSYVLRRKPPGALVKGAHAVDREARVLSALGKVDFPVAHVYGLCQDDSIIGGWFYVMDMVEGRIFWDAALPDIARWDRGAIYDAMNATIAQLHAVDYREIGLESYGKSGHYCERQISRWSRAYHDDPDAGRDPNMDRLIIWLQAHLPLSDETTIVHGDYRIDNMIFHPTEPRVVAVLDWELSTLGHPLADFANHALMYRMPPTIVAGLSGVDPHAVGLPSEREYIAAYCRRTGRDDIPDYRFYVALNLFRLAAIFHGILGRAIRGTAAHAQAAERGKSFAQLAALAWRATQERD